MTLPNLNVNTNLTRKRKNRTK